MKSLKIEIYNKGAGLKVSESKIEKLCLRLFQRFKNHPIVKRSKASNEFSDLSVIFLSASESRKLNQKYRKKNYATDILSFAADLKAQGLGELAICPQILKIQAKNQGHSFKKELDYMIIHGFLHLIGYDHEKSLREELKMFKLQDRLFAELSKKE